MASAPVVVRGRGRAAIQVAFAAAAAMGLAGAMGLAAPFGVLLASLAAGVTAKVAPAQRLWVKEGTLVVEGWHRSRVVHLSEVQALSLSFVKVDPPTLEIIYARSKALGPISLEQSSKPFLSAFASALDAYGPADDRYIRENLDWVRRFLRRS